jgi:hypothetical protein
MLEIGVWPALQFALTWRIVVPYVAAVQLCQLPALFISHCTPEITGTVPEMNVAMAAGLATTTRLLLEFCTAEI